MIGPDPCKDLTGMNSTSKDLTRMNLTGMNLTRKDLTGTDSTRADLPPPPPSLTKTSQTAPFGQFIDQTRWSNALVKCAGPQVPALRPYDCRVRGGFVRGVPPVQAGAWPPR
jgi:hypothetical protein